MDVFESFKAAQRGPEMLSPYPADKLDLLTGFFAIGEKPTGSKDPYALRRAAHGQHQRGEPLKGLRTRADQIPQVVAWGDDQASQPGRRGRR